MVYMETFGDRLRTIRKKAGETQLDVARIARVTKQAISKMERAGVVAAAASTVEPIARHYRVNLRWLLTGEGDKQRQSSTDPVSRPAVLDPEMVAETYQALRRVYESVGRTFDIEAEPERFVHLYEFRTRMPERPSNNDWIEFGQNVAAFNTARGSEKDAGLESGADDGSRKKRVV